MLGIVVELIALFNKEPDDTLSEHVWKYITGQRHPGYIPASAAWAGRIVLAVFLGWLAPHFIFGIWH